jgi:hypothetical protein
MLHVNFDISWNEVAKYVVASPASMQAVADVINRYPDRFLFGTDEVAPSDKEKYRGSEGRGRRLLPQHQG